MADQEFLASGPVSVAPAMNLLSAVAGLALLLGTAALRPDNAYAQEINFDQINKFESLGTVPSTLARHQRRLSMMANATL